MSLKTSALYKLLIVAMSAASLAHADLTNPAQPNKRLPNFEHIHLPQCQHGLRLTGTITGGVKSAFISVDDLPENSYAIGQSITKDTVLISVYSKSVVIRHDNALERLTVSRPTSTDETTVELTDTNSPVLQSDNNDDLEHSDIPLDNNHKPQTQVAKPVTKPYRFMGVPVDIEDFMTQAKFTPQPSGGLTISDSVPDGIYDRLGLQDGDNIQSLSGTRINSMLDVSNFIQRNSDAKEMQVLVLRNSNYYVLNMNRTTGIEMEMVVDPAKINQ